MVSLVTLRPQVVFSGLPKPTEADFLDMHHEAHDECFIANSVMTAVKCEAALRDLPFLVT
ncbi:MAG: hypothetical protein ACKO2L_18090 [Planctomycetaceae bacterium]